jgi:hypothetical protein
VIGLPARDVQQLGERIVMPDEAPAVSAASFIPNVAGVRGNLGLGLVPVEAPSGYFGTDDDDDDGDDDDPPYVNPEVAMALAWIAGAPKEREDTPSRVFDSGDVSFASDFGSTVQAIVSYGGTGVDDEPNGDDEDDESSWDEIDAPYYDDECGQDEGEFPLVAVEPDAPAAPEPAERPPWLKYRDEPR